MDFRVLGRVEAVSERGVVALGGLQRRLLLAVLLSRPGEIHSAATLANALWADDPPPAATRVLHSQLARLRRLLEPDRPPRAPAQLLRSVHDGYVIDLAGHGLDAARFASLVDQGQAAGRAGDPATAKGHLTDGLRLWQAPPFGGLSTHPMLAAAVAALEQRQVSARESLADARLALGEHAEIVADLETLVRLHPFGERLWGQFMLALYRSGRQADALATYQRCRRLLVDELGIQPATELQALNDAILVQKPELDWRAAAAPGPTSTPVRHAEVTAVSVITDGRRPASELVRSLAAADEPVLAKAEDDARVALAVFDSPASAVAAVAELQRGLAPQPDRPLVRAAVHTGPAISLDDEWFGSAVTEALRLSSLAHADQVLVSEATAERVEAELPGGATLRDLGLHRLPGRTGMERLYQLWQPGTPADVRPWPASAAVANLPVETTSFVGRRHELDELAGLLATTRLLTLVGPGGCGKTRLALRAARQALDAHPHGMFFVDLASVGDPEQVPELIARQLRLRQQPDHRILGTIVDHLRRRQVLLVLDNCEHLIRAAAETVQVVLAERPGVTVLGTTRERFGVAGELIWPVPALPVPDDDSTAAVERSGAARLFFERARAVAPDFALSAAAAPHVAAICHRLDGMPLAIELAAARARVLSPAQILERLDDRFALLRTAARSATPRHRTLRAVVDWSYDLLDADEQRLFTALSVFAGSFSLPAAEAVGGSGALDGLTQLVDKSLVQVIAGDEARYRLLETLRSYGAERLRAEPRARQSTEAARTAFFADFCEHAAREIRGPDDLDWLTRVDRDYENIQAALAWALDHDHVLALRLCGALGEYWFHRGRYRDGATMTRAALDAAPPDAPGRGAALTAATWMAYSTGVYREIATVAQEAHTVALAEDDRTAQAIALILLTATSADICDVPGALQHGAALSEVDLGAGQWAHAAALSLLASVHLRVGDTGAARQLVERALPAARSSGWRTFVIHSLRTAARLASMDGDGPARTRSLRAALSVAADAGLVRQVVWCLGELGQAMRNDGDIATARGFGHEAIRIANDISGSEEIAQTEWLLATLDRMTGDLAGARRRLDIVRQNPNYVAAALIGRGEIEWLDGSTPEAANAYHAARECARPEDRALPYPTGVSAHACAVIGLAVVQDVPASALHEACLQLRTPDPHEASAWYLAVAARALSRSLSRAGSDAASDVGVLLGEAIDRSVQVGDLFTDVRIAEQVAHLATEGDPETRVQLLGATTAIRDARMMHRAPSEAAWHRDTSTALRRSLGDAAWTEADRLGTTLGRGEMTRLARVLL